MRTARLNVEARMSLTSKGRKLKIVDSQPSEPKTPPNARESSLSQRKTRYSSNTNGLNQDNSEYWSYKTASSNSNKKGSDINLETVNNRSKSITQLNEQNKGFYVNWRESYKNPQKATIEISENDLPSTKARQWSIKQFGQLNNIPIVFDPKQVKNLAQNSNSFQMCKFKYLNLVFEFR